MIALKRTNSSDPDFQSLVKLLDEDLAVRDGAIEHDFYAQFNKIDKIKNVVIAFAEGEVIGCGAIKDFNGEAMEIKRMYVLPKHRGQGIAHQIIKELECWTRELDYKFCVLETGKKQPEAIALYFKAGFQITDNYGQYVGIGNSICFKKQL